MEQVLNKRDIVLLPFPFTDGSGAKRRPALVMSLESFNKSSQDVIVCGMSAFNSGEERIIAVKKEDWEKGLWSESYVKPSYIAAVDKRVIIQKIGRLSKERHAEVLSALLTILGAGNNE